MKASLLLFFGKLSRWIRDVLSSEGDQSSMRLVMIASWGCVLTVWTSLSFWHHAMQPVEASVLTLLGLATAGKCIQNHTGSNG